jgi:SAM-dependent methyltransferase
MPRTIAEVRQFWEKNPLWAGESAFEAGSREFFEEHARVVVEDGFAGRIDERIFPRQPAIGPVLDLGCGPGFWTIELARRGFQVTAADLTERALELARQRCSVFGVSARFCLQNAERMSFPDASFAHVNCQGVIHHTPDTEACVAEIARVLKPGGTASISVYYRNVFLRAWPALRPVGGLITRLGAGLKGRGREDIFAQREVSEIVRLYDGLQNPIGKCYSRGAFLRLVQPFFRLRETFLHFFPARALPVRIPPALHRFLDRHAGFLIYASLTRD